MRPFSRPGPEGPRNELILPWALSVAANVLVAVITSDSSNVSLVIGGVGLAAGGLLAIVSMMMLGEGQRLVREGPYRFVRHPFYLGLLLMLGGALVATRSLAGAALFLPAFLITVARARREEHNLELRYGSRYTEYRDRVPFLFPVQWRKSTPPGRGHGGKHDQSD